MSEKTEIEELLKNIQLGLKKFTLKELNESLYYVLKSKVDKQKDKKKHIDIVINLVCAEFNLKKEQLIHGRGKGIVQDARKIAYCILHFNLNLPIRYVAKRIFFLNWHTSVGAVIQYHNSLNLSIKPDKDFKDKLDLIQTKAISKIENQK